MTTELSTFLKQYVSTGLRDDNGKAIFGAGSDLQIYHDGSNSYITDSGTGNLLVQGNGLKLQNPSGETYINCIRNLS